MKVAFLVKNCLTIMYRNFGVNHRDQRHPPYRKHKYVDAPKFLQTLFKKRAYL